MKGLKVCLSAGAGEGLPAIFEPQGIVGHPATYDLRSLGRLTNVRDQGSSGCCWAFATYSSLESCLMPGEVRNFSENNLKNTHGFDIGPNDGGNHEMSTAYLVRWGGPVNESADPYVPTSTYSPVLPATKHVQEVLYVPDRANSTDNDNLKQVIQAYGAVYTSCYWSGSYYNTPNRSYYYSGGADSNHAIALVGWNDSYSRSKFASAPPGDGAFIARNSWGSYWGEGGYFYISYYDSVVGSSNAVFTAGPLDDYDRVYQRDPLGWTGNWGYGDDAAWLAANYTAAANETLAAAGFYTPQVNSGYEVYVYTNGALAATATGTYPLPGYHTVPLGTPVSLSAGQQFRVAVRLHTPGYNYPICMEHQIGGYTSGAVSNASESFISHNGVTWTDFGASAGIPTNRDVCLKAYTVAAGGGPQLPSLDFAAASYSVGEGGGNATITVLRAGNVSLPASVGYAVTGGNATAGSDYAGGAGTLQFAPDAGSASFDVTVLNDAIYEGNETIVLSLNSPVNATLGTNASMTVTIIDDDPAPVISIASATYNVNENAGKVTITLTRTGATALSSRVNYATANGNASSGWNYTVASGTLTFVAGSDTQYVDVPIVYQNGYDYNRFFYLNISAPANCTLGATKSSTITIVNTDPMPVVQIASATYSVSENAGKVTIALSETGSTALQSKVNYATSNGNATAPSNYTATSGTATLAPGNQTCYIDVPIVDNAQYGSNRFFYLNISAPANCTLGATRSATVTIVDDEAPPTIVLSAATYRINENAGKVTVTVQRVGNTALVASVSYATASGSARSPGNFTATSGTLTFPANNATQYFDVPVVNVPGYNANVFFFVNLSAPANATLGAPGATQVWIDNVDPPVTTNFTIDLVPGWNLISLPLVPQDGNISAVLPAEVLSGILHIWGWDEAAQNWVYYTPGPSNYFSQHYPAITQLLPGKAYWFKVNRTMSFTEQGIVPDYVPDCSINLVPGWNFVGTTGLSSIEVQPMYPTALAVWGWDEAAQNWVYYTPGPSNYFSQHYPGLNTTQPGHGYWVKIP